MVRSEKPSRWRWGTIWSPILCHWCIQFSACKFANISTVNLPILILLFFSPRFSLFAPSIHFSTPWVRVLTSRHTHTQTNNNLCLQLLVCSNNVGFYLLTVSSCHLTRVFVLETRVKHTCVSLRDSLDFTHSNITQPNIVIKRNRSPGLSHIVDSFALQLRLSGPML